MIIVRNDKKNIVEFSFLKNGDVFRYEEGIFMVIKKVENKSGGVYNAIDLKNGELTFFYTDEEVTVLKAELVVS